MMLQAVWVGLAVAMYGTCTQPPVITLLGDSPLTIHCNQPYVERGAQAYSPCFGDISARVRIDSSQVNTAVPGTYEVLYTCTDIAGNTATAIRRVIVPDVFHLTVNGAMFEEGGVAVTYWSCGVPYDDPGAFAYDGCDGDLSRNIIVTGVSDVQPWQLGAEYTITYRVSNRRGVTLVRTRQVRIVDVDEPVIALQGEGQVPLNFLEPGDPDPAWWSAALVSYAMKYPDAEFPLPTRWRWREEWEPAPTPYFWHCNKPSYEDPGAIAYDFCDGPLDPADIVMVLTRFSAEENREVFVYVGRMGDFATDPPPRLWEDQSRQVWRGYRAYYLICDSSGNPGPGSSGWRTVRSRLIDPTYRVGFIGIPGETALQCHDPFDPRANVIAYDLCQGDITARMFVTGHVNTSVPGDYFIRYDVWNDYGTGGWAARRVLVVDNESPIIVLLNEDGTPAQTPVLTIPWCSLRDQGVDWWEDEAGWFALRPNKGWRVQDRCDDNAWLTNRVFLYGADELRTALEFLAAPRDQGVDPEPYLRVYPLWHNVRDSSNNPAMPAIRYVEVVATTPQITLVERAEEVVECGEPYIDAGITVQDACETDLVIIGGDAVPLPDGRHTVRTDVPGNRVITYRVVNAINREATAQRIVRVLDTLPPEVTLTPRPGVTIIPSLEWNRGVPFIPAEVVTVTAADLCEGTLVAQITDRGGMDFSSPQTGWYRIRWSVVDRTGNQGVADLRVNVEADPLEGEVEERFPSIFLNGAAEITLECGDSFVDPGARAQDEVDGDLTARIRTINPVDAWRPAAYTVRYEVTNTANNTASVTRRVVIADTVPPVLTLRGEPRVTVVQGDRFNDPGATAMDACEGRVNVVVDGYVNVNRIGEYILEYRAVDRSGNEADPLTRVVRVEAAPKDQEGEAVDEGEGEAANEGEGEAPEPPDDNGCVGCEGFGMTLRDNIRRILGDYLLFGVSMTALLAWTMTRKRF